MSQQTQELSVARGRPLPQQKVKGVWQVVPTSPSCSSLERMCHLQPPGALLSEKESDNNN